MDAAHCTPLMTALNFFFRPMNGVALNRRTILSRIPLALPLACACLLAHIPSTLAQVNQQGQRPYLGWSSWSQQVVHSSGWLTEAQIKAQSDALKASGLQAHGFLYINIDSGWQSGFDANGLPMVNTTRFPDGLAATIQYIHNNGQKAGIYWVPGIQQPVYDTNGLILGTSYSLDSIVLPGVPGNAFSYGQSNPWHKKIDFTQPGAQAYVNSVVALFASWGVDLIKLDGVTPGSDHNDLLIDNRAEVAAWSQAIAHSGRSIWLTVSWALDHNYAADWQAQANARRIEDDIDCRCGTLTSWTVVARRFNDLVLWQNDAGPTRGWNDLDSLEVGNGAQDGLTGDERQSAVSLWAIANAPLYLGDDLTQLDSFGTQLLSNDEILAVDQSGVPGTQVQGGSTPIWAANLGGGAYNVALFNLGSAPATVALNFSSLGIAGSAALRDLWARSNLGIFNGSYSAVLGPHASQLLKVTLSSAAPSITAAPTALALSGSAGHATAELTVTPNGSSSTLAFACANLPTTLQCGFNPATMSVAGLSSPQTVTLTVTRTNVATARSVPLFTVSGLILSLPLLFWFTPAVLRASRVRLLAGALLLLASLGLFACGSSSASGSVANSSTYGFQVNVTAGSTLVQTIPFTIAVE